MEMGLIHPPVGLKHLRLIRNVAPDIPLSEVIWGTLPFVLADDAGRCCCCASSRRFSTSLPIW